MKVSDVMTRNVVTVGPGTPLKDVSRVLLERRISGVPVVEGGRVVGVVSNKDILFKEREPVIAIRPGALISEAATRMLEHGVNRLPVIEDGKRFGEIESGHLVGIVTHRDLVRAFARSDDEIAQEVRALIDSELPIPTGRVTCQVRKGEVSLDGNVEWFSTAELLVDQVKRVPGVVAVHSRLAWRELEPDFRGPTTTMTDRI